MKRRTFINTLAMLPLAAKMGSLWAAPAAQAKLLVVFLRGGYDAANLLIPVASQFYYDSRPNIAVPRPGTDLNTALPLNSDWGLHPALRESIYPLYQNGQAAFIPFAGTEDMTRSHFETQDGIELGQPLTGSRNYASGFLNRLSATLNGDPAIAFTDQLPIIMQGSVQVPNSALRSLAKPALDQRQSDIIAAMYKGTPLSQQVNEGFTVRNELAQELAGEMQAASRNAITAKGFELEGLRAGIAPHRPADEGKIQHRLRRRRRLGHARRTGQRHRLPGRPLRRTGTRPGRVLAGDGRPVEGHGGGGHQ